MTSSCVWRWCVVQHIWGLYVCASRVPGQESGANPLAKAKVSLSTRALHVYEASLAITPQLNWLQHVMFHWFYTTAFFGTLFIATILSTMIGLFILWQQVSQSDHHPTADAHQDRSLLNEIFVSVFVSGVSAGVRGEPGGRHAHRRARRDPGLRRQRRDRSVDGDSFLSPSCIAPSLLELICKSVGLSPEQNLWGGNRGGQGSRSRG